MNQEPRTVWDQLSETSIFVWAALIAGVLYVMSRDKDAPFAARISSAGVSGFGAFATYTSVATWTGLPQELCMILLSAFGYAILDVGYLVLRSPEFRAGLRDAVITRIGGKSNGSGE